MPVTGAVGFITSPSDVLKQFLVCVCDTLSIGPEELMKLTERTKNWAG